MRSKFNSAALVCLMLVLSATQAFAQFTASVGNNDTICANGRDTLIVTSTGGTPAYNFQWSNGGTTQSIVVSPLSSTTYSVTVTDGVAATATASITVTVNPFPQLDSLTVTNVSCNGGNNGAACVYAQGAVLPYQWSNGATGQCITGLSAWLYSVTFTNSYGCTASAAEYVSEQPAISLTPQTTNALCNNVFNGSIVVTDTGGTPPYRYSLNWGQVQSSNAFTGLGAGTYTLDVWDTLGCFDSLSVNIQNSSSVTGSVSNSSNTWCYNTPGDTISASIFGGTPPYTYSINGSVFQSSGVFVVNTPHVYVVTERDQNGCTVFLPDTIWPASPQMTDQLTVTNVSCHGSNNGSVISSLSGGTSPYTALWSNFQSSFNISGLSGGLYYVIFTDHNGCSIRDSATIMEPAPFVATVTPVNSTCGLCNGSANIALSGGASPYTWNLWFGSNVVCQMVGCTLLCPGNYIWIINDANNCQTRDTFTIGQSSAPVIDSVVVTNAACYGGLGSACVYASGGGPFTYAWSNGTTGQCITQLGVGTYTVTITNSTGCTATASGIITSPSQLYTSDTLTNACFGNNTGTIKLMVYGGTPAYTFLWSNSATTQNLSNVSGGNYFITVTDAHGCRDSALYVVHQAPPLVLQVTAIDSNAIPDTISLSVAGGNPPYSFSWGDGQAGSDSNHIYNAIGIFIGTVTDLNGCFLTYRVDAGCTDQCVWPGDANYDGTVDNNDLLAIGVGYDSTGFTRLNATISFIPQYCVPWTDTLLGNINYKHVDCNGDGIINATDTDAILLNYYRTHPRSGGDQNWKNNAPVLHVKVSPDTLVDGQIATATLSLGDSALPCTNVYGVAFTYNFDPLVVDTNSVSINFGNSWLAGTGDHINISKTFYGPGQLQAAITRIDHVNRSGQGVIGTVSLKITTGNINGKDLSYYLMNNFITWLKVIDNLGNVLPINEGSDSVQVAFTPTAINTVKNDLRVQIFPNPANDQLNITTSLSGIEAITIVDLTGKEVLRQNMVSGGNFILNIPDLSAGVYMINIKAREQEYHSRFVKVNVK